MKPLALKKFAILPLILVGCGEAPLAPAPAAPPSRNFPWPAAPVEAKLPAGEVHLYQFGELAPGQALALRVHQQGVDLVAEIIGPGGQIALRVDAPSAEWGPEVLCFRVKTPGPHQLRLAGFAGNRGGPYRLEPGEAQDPQRFAACEDATRQFAAAEDALRRNAPAEAAGFYKQSLAAWGRSGETFLQALMAKEVGILVAREGQLELALSFYQQAIAILGRPAAVAELRQLAAVHNYLGVAFGHLGEPGRAREQYLKAQALAREAGDRRAEAAAISKLALLAAGLGELHQAVALHHEELAIWQELTRRGEAAGADEATTRNLLGGVLTQLGRFELARDQLRVARRLREPGPPEPRAHTELAIGWTESLAGNGDAAVAHLEAAIALYREARSTAGEADAWDRYGSALMRLGRREEARLAYEKGLAHYARGENVLYLAHSEANLGCLLLDRSLLASAAATFEAIGDRAAAAHVAFCQARLEQQQGHLPAALAAAEVALAHVDQLRAAALRQGYPGPTLDLWQSYEELEVDLRMALEAAKPGQGHAARAFARSDLFRARHLYEQLLEAEVKVRSDVPAALLEREREAQRQVGEAEQRRASLAQNPAAPARPGPQLATAAAELRARLAELEEAQAAIRAASPRFAALRQPAALPLGEVQALLEPDTLLLSYVLGTERSYLFLVSREGFVSHVLPRREVIDTLALRFYEGLKSSRQRRVQAQLPAVAGELSRVLLGSVAARLEGRRLLVVGDGLLHYVPFAALPLAGVSPSAGGGERLRLVDRFDVVHLPSAAVMQALRQRQVSRALPGKELAMVAAPVYRGPSGEEGEWRELPHTAAEAQGILAMVRPEQRLAALGLAARPELVRSGGLAGYRILHFAAHGLLNEEQPELSGVMLSMWDEKGQPQDGSLRLHEIYALDLPAELVVLSACRTALTPKSQGAGLLGLTHGFFYAGASRLLVSLWDVDDEATAELMRLFYQGLLQEKLRPAEALRRAQCALKAQERYAAEYFWAGFVLEGDWS